MFWTVTFPRLVCAEPVIAKCLIVLVTSHERVQSSTRPFAQEPECLEKFIEAITLLRKEWNSMSVDCILVASIVLAIAELSFGPSPSGLSHLYAGSRIIRQRRAHPEDYAHHRSSPEIDGVRESIELLYEAFFARMDRKSDAITPCERAFLKTITTSEASMPLTFYSTQQALGSLESITTTALDILRNKSSETNDVDHINLQQIAEEWLRAFQILEAELNCTTDPEFLKACLVIRITGLATLVIASIPSSELSYSQHKAEFLQIADFAEEFLKVGGGMTQSVMAHLVYGIGPVNPIFFAATKCRIPTVRNRLLQALRRFKVVEGLWTSCAAYQVALQVAEIENNITEAEPDPTTIGWSTRITLDSVTFDDPAHISMKYYRESNAGGSLMLSKTVSVQACRHQGFLNQVRLNTLTFMPNSNISLEPSRGRPIWGQPRIC